MNDREKLIAKQQEAIKICGNRNCVVCVYRPKGFNCKYELIADHLIANGVTIQRWISVTERLPEETRDEYVLVVCDYYGKIKVETRKMWHIDACVTHWMPLPQPPKEVE